MRSYLTGMRLWKSLQNWDANASSVGKDDKGLVLNHAAGGPSKDKTNSMICEEMESASPKCGPAWLIVHIRK